MGRLVWASVPSYLSYNSMIIVFHIWIYFFTIFHYSSNRKILCSYVLVYTRLTSWGTFMLFYSFERFAWLSTNGISIIHKKKCLLQLFFSTCEQILWCCCFYQILSNLFSIFIIPWFLYFGSIQFEGCSPSTFFVKGHMFFGDVRKKVRRHIRTFRPSLWQFSLHPRNKKHLTKQVCSYNMW